MPQQWSPKRERQYDKIKESQREEGRSEERAEEIAARTVNKQRARAGESDQRSTASIHDISAPRRGGLRSANGPRGRTKAQLYEDAKRADVRGRSTMTKDQLKAALEG